MQNIYLLAFGTFGNPYGFRQSFILFDKENVAKSIKTFDLNTNAIKLYQNTTIYSIRKEIANGLNSVAYSKYTFAKEQNSDRGGTFIGASIFYTNEIAQENLTINKLNEFHKKLVEKNIVNETIMVKHSDDFSVDLPKDFDKLGFNFKKLDKLNNFNLSNSNLLVFSRINEDVLQHHFENSLDLLNIYDTIYFTDSKEITDFTRSKGIFKTIAQTDFDVEINNLIEDRKRKREQSISEFKREVQRIREDKNQSIQEFKNQIEQSERIHLENAQKLKESKEDINKIGQFYDDFLNKTNGLINQLNHNNGKLEEVKQIHNSNKIRFNNGISDLKRPDYTTKIAKPKPKGNLHTEQPRQEFEHRRGHRRREETEEFEDKVYKIDKYKIATLVLAFLLIVTWVYFLFLKSNSEKASEVIQNQEQVNTVPQEQKTVEITKIENLKPISNSTLNEKDYRIVAKSLKPNMKLEDVVKVIFSKNPTEISSVYSGQEAIYSKLLLELNEKCFEEKEGIYYFAKDTLRQIPSYKKQL
jgi:hypothetical protein